MPVTRTEVRVEYDDADTTDATGTAVPGDGSGSTAGDSHDSTVSGGSVIDATDDTDDGSGDMILTEERVVVTKETVPVKRVRLAKETVTAEEQVTDTVRKERIETEGVDETRSP